jgi:hypothetical protein
MDRQPLLVLDLRHGACDERELLFVLAREEHESLVVRQAAFTLSVASLADSATSCPVVLPYSSFVVTFAIVFSSDLAEHPMLGRGSDD